jgi:protein-tyrosine phosphatase
MLIDCNEIIPSRLWVGRFVRYEEVRVLQQMEITTVLSLQSDDDLAWYGVPERKLSKAFLEAGIESRRIPVPDFNIEALDHNISECAVEIRSALAPPWTRVYLHCTAGINRAPTAAAAYLMLAQGISAQEAFNCVTSRRHCSPYIDVLQHYEITLKASRVTGRDSV